MKKIVAVVIFSFASLQAGAAETLHLRMGDVSLQDHSQIFLQNSLSINSVSSGTEQLYVVQFEGAVPAGSEAQLKNAGLTPLRYLPDSAYLVRASLTHAGVAKSAVPGLSVVTQMAPEWKISPEFKNAKASAMETVVISSADDQAAFQVATELAKIAGIRVRMAESHEIIADVPAAAIDAIAQINAVEWIQRLPVFMTMDFAVDGVGRGPGDSPDYVYTGYESGTKIMGFEAAWARGYMGEGQAVGVCDTGLDSGDLSTVFMDFKGNLRKGYAVGLGASSWADPMGHGTHVAGSVAGNGTASDMKIHGGAYKAGLVSLGLWSDILDNLAPGTDFSRLFTPARNEGARIVTNSWGGAGNPGVYDTFASKADEYMWNNPDMLVLFAAGNSGQDLDKDGRIDENSIGTPGTAKSVLTVGASENLLLVGGIQKKAKDLRDGMTKWGAEPIASDTVSNNPNGMALFSSRGPTADKRIKPEIAAPGTNIISNRSHTSTAEALWGDFNKDYVYSGGTSMATPLAAGAAAVSREFLVKSFHVANPQGALVKAYMMHTAFDMYPGQYGTGPKQELPTQRPNIHEGYGRVDMDQATALGAETQVIDQTTGVGTGESATYTAHVTAGKLRATLAWSDAPGSPSAAKALVNDLDLIIMTPSGEMKTKADHINPGEMLEFTGLAAGDYQVIVKGVTVPSGKGGKQPFGLVVSAE